MKLINSNQIKTGDILAEDICLDGTVLITKGTILKEDYISNLTEMEIELIYIENPEEDFSKYLLEEEFLQKQYEVVKEILERLIISNIASLEKLKAISDELVNHVGHRSYSSIILPSRKPDLYYHSLYVSGISILLGKKLGLADTELRELAFAALIHDMGYRFVASRYENVDIDKLTPGEIFEIKKHTIYAFTALENHNWISDDGKMVILSHHERVDGSGYPLKQKSLSEASRIVCIADAYDSLISGNGCKVHQPEEAFSIMKNEKAGYDEKIFKLFEDTFFQ